MIMLAAVLKAETGMIPLHSGRYRTIARFGVGVMSKSAVAMDLLAQTNLPLWWGILYWRSAQSPRSQACPALAEQR